MRKYKFFKALLFIAVFFFIAQNQAFAKDEWLRVQSKNFHLIGNTSEKDIRKVATKLEQFRETFRLLLRNANFNSAIPTNVIVFKSGSAYKPFKPKRADGKVDEFIAGYFIGGSDVNYITLSVDGEEKDTFGTIFHEYVHFLVNNNFGKGEVPPWFNEGLAEYYQTFEIEADSKAKLGLPQFNHLELLKDNKLIPLETLLSVTNYSLKQNGNHSRSIFYAQSWALIHYLQQTANGAKRDSMFNFLSAIIKKVPLEKAFRDSFQMSFAEMEKELRSYISKGTYNYQMYSFKTKLVFDNEMQVTPLPDAESNAYLGDLLFRIQQPAEAEKYLQKSLASDPNSNHALVSLGALKIRERKFDEAKLYLEKAIKGDPKSHSAYYNYAYLLSRESVDEFGYVSSFGAGKSAQMREALNKAITLNPTFIESYELLGFINLVSNEQLEETIQILKKALSFNPGNQDIIMRIAEILARLEKFDDAENLADRVAAITDEESIKGRAESLKRQIDANRDIKTRNENARRQYEEAMKNSGQGGSRPIITRRQQELSPEEEAKLREKEELISINRTIRRNKSNKNQIVGRIQKITCVNNKITYSIKTDTAVITLFSKDFENLALISFDDEAQNAQIGCDANLSKFNAVLTYQPVTEKSTNLGELFRIDFVPANFKFLNEEEMKSDAVSGQPQNISDNPTISNETSEIEKPTDFEEMRRNAMMKALEQALAKPKDGEKREQGFIEKIECDSKSMYFLMKTSSQILKLKATNPAIRAFTPDGGGQQFGCGMKSFDIPAVFIYKADPNPKAKIQGELISIDFVPKSFKLEN